MGVADVRRFTANLDRRRNRDDVFTAMMRFSAAAKVDDLPEPRWVHFGGTADEGTAAAAVFVEPADASRWVRAMAGVIHGQNVTDGALHRRAEGTLHGLQIRVTWVEPTDT